MTHYTATYDPAHSRWELRTPAHAIAVAYNCDLHPMDAKGAIDWVRHAVTDFDAAPEYLGVTSGATPRVQAATGTGPEGSR